MDGRRPIILLERSPLFSRIIAISLSLLLLYDTASIVTFVTSGPYDIKGKENANGATTSARLIDLATLFATTLLCTKPLLIEIWQVNHSFWVCTRTATRGFYITFSLCAFISLPRLAFLLQVLWRFWWTTFLSRWLHHLWSKDVLFVASCALAAEVMSCWLWYLETQK